ncbi:MAG: hypothetical protein JXL84_01910 [Deltaproteobacteria bacterium]|nr:hypothetical protein [Deltaproteobacteria bacterium]
MGPGMLPRMIQRYLFGLLLLVFLHVFCVPDTSARPFRLATLPDRGAKFGCGTCHVRADGGGPRNPFGRSWENVVMKSGDKYNVALGAMDSDTDSFSNDREFEAGTHPGDPRSKPSGQAAK